MNKFDDYIYEILQDYNVQKGWYLGIDETHITFLLEKATPVDFEDSEFTEVELNHRFDIWGKNEEEVSRYYNEIINILKENDFKWQQTLNDFENNIELYHICIFTSIDIDIDKYTYL